MIDTYDWPGGREAVLRLGSETAPRIVAAAALFEEGNRSRALLVALLRRLSGYGVAAALPDLPGTNESLVASEAVTLADWRSAFASVVAERPSFVLSLRGGALLETGLAVLGRYRIAPIDGARVVRDLLRTRRIAEPSFDWPTASASGASVELSGYLLSPELIDALRSTSIEADARVVRLTTDPLPASRTVEGRPAWLNGEPDADEGLVATLASDIADWMRGCAG